jgi:hypothetical protein
MISCSPMIHYYEHFSKGKATKEAIITWHIWKPIFLNTIVAGVIHILKADTQKTELQKSHSLLPTNNSTT